MSWNVGGWTNNNGWSRECVVVGLNCDIVVLQETHLIGDSKLNVPGYLCEKMYFHNRKNTHVRAKKGFGGVAFLFKHSFLLYHTVNVIDKTIDGLIIVKVTRKCSDYCFIVAGCYLPPEQSVWGRDAVNFYAHILHIVYQYSDVDAFYICGDLNSRIGNKNDFIHGIDEIDERDTIDYTLNNHGTALHEFLLDSRFCVVNGRVSRENNNFTFVHPRGRSVVDYFLVPIECISTCKSFQVVPPGEVFEKCCPAHLDKNSGSLSDHSVLMLTINFAIEINDDRVSRVREHEYENVISPNDIFFQRFRIDNMPENFMNTAEAGAALVKISQCIENIVKDQTSIDILYDKFCQVYHTEMKKFFTSINIYPSVKKFGFRRKKPFWNSELQTLWTEVCRTEQIYVRSRGNEVQNAKQSFKNAQYLFDKTYRREKRLFQRTQFNSLEKDLTENPKEFWKLLKRLGPHKKIHIPLEVYDEQNNVNSNITYVMNKWKSDYENLFSLTENVDNSIFDDQFYNDCCVNLINLEQHVQVIPGLDHDITENEVKKVIKDSKNRKAVGIDNLPNEIFKNQNSVNILAALFNAIFESNTVPSKWKKALLKPIPKASTIDPRLPLEYRGISILSTVYKLFSSLLNLRLMQFAERNGLLHDEQNGFRRSRSCEDHCFVLSSIIRNRKANNLSTFVGLIDFKKAFDCVDRTLLMYKLLRLGVGGKFYKNLKNIYSQCETAINLNGYISNFFACDYGVRQGDCLSSTLFILFIDDLISDLKNGSVGIRNEYFNLQCLLYADDLTLISASENDLQSM